MKFIIFLGKMFWSWLLRGSLVLFKCILSLMLLWFISVIFFFGQFYKISLNSLALSEHMFPLGAILKTTTLFFLHVLKILLFLLCDQSWLPVYLFSLSHLHQHVLRTDLDQNLLRWISSKIFPYPSCLYRKRILLYNCTCYKRIYIF